MELLILFVVAVVWMVIKSLAEAPPPQRPQPRRREAKPAPQEDVPFAQPRSPISAGQQYFADQPEEKLEVEELDDLLPAMDQGRLFSADSLVQGVIMSEILGRPRAKKPYGRRH